MIHPTPRIIKKKSRLALRARTANTTLLFLILVLMATVAAVIIMGINEEAATNRVRTYSIEAAQVFYSYISRDLTLVQKASYSKAITEWCADEKDEGKRAQAFFEMMDYAAIVANAHLYIGISESGNEYTIVNTTSLEDFVPISNLEPSIIENAWNFKRLDSENSYNLNIGIDTSNNNWHLWINHKVFSGGELAGIFCSGLRIPDVFRQVFGRKENIRGYIINKYGVIQLASAISGIYREKTERHIGYASDDPEFTQALDLYLKSIDGFFVPNSQPEVIKLSEGGSYGHASIAPIFGSDWSVIVFYDSNFLASIAYLLPLVFVMVAALLLYVAGRNTLMNRLIFRPIQLLTQSVSGGEFDKVIYGSGRDDEIGKLARTIQNAGNERRQMLKEIRDSSAKLETALEEARAASQAKSNFLANMSHEMRTPLNAVIGLSELTLEGGGLSDDTASNLEKIYNAGTTLLSTVNDILDISKIEAGRLELVPAEYDIPSLINDAITQSILRIGEKPIKFTLDIDGSLPVRLYGDDLRIKQILNNLLSNAFKYTNEGTVELSVSCHNGDAPAQAGEPVWMTIRVSDTGVGIRNGDLKNLFFNYNQLDKLIHRKIEGTGLGLPITKRIAEMMDGSISVESEYGKGSIFTVVIRQQFVNDTVIGEDGANSLKEFRHSDQKRRKNLRLERVNMSYARVLVVDDVPANIDVARGMMKAYGMQIDCVTSAQEAIEIIRAGDTKYNAIFMDHMMPIMDGIEAVKIIREEIESEYAKTVPIIALTANAIVGNEEMFLSRGFQAFLSKPIEMSRLDAVLMEWVHNKELEQASSRRRTLMGIQNRQNRFRSLNDQGENSSNAFQTNIAGLDIKKGLERFNGDNKVYAQILRAYVTSVHSLLETFVNVNRDNLDSYAIAVHGIKGASWGISAQAVGNMAQALEKAAREGDMDFILTGNPAFVKAVENLAADIELMFNKTPAEDHKPKKDKPDREALSRLLAACDAYNMDGIDAAMAEIEEYEYEYDGGLALWLRENVDSANFAPLKERLINITAAVKEE